MYGWVYKFYSLYPNLDCLIDVSEFSGNYVIDLAHVIHNIVLIMIFLAVKLIFTLIIIALLCGSTSIILYIIWQNIMIYYRIVCFLIDFIRYVCHEIIDFVKKKDDSGPPNLIEMIMIFFKYYTLEFLLLHLFIHSVMLYFCLSIIRVSFRARMILYIFLVVMHNCFFINNSQRGSKFSKEITQYVEKKEK
jgi:hypothetical protein